MTLLGASGASAACLQFLGSPALAPDPFAEALATPPPVVALLIALALTIGVAVLGFLLLLTVSVLVVTVRVLVALTRAALIGAAVAAAAGTVTVVTAIALPLVLVLGIPLALGVRFAARPGRQPTLPTPAPTATHSQPQPTTHRVTLAAESPPAVHPDGLTHALQAPTSPDAMTRRPPNSPLTLEGGSRQTSGHPAAAG